MLCVMHSAKPYGHLVVNGHPVTDTQLASLSGLPLDQVTALKVELENAGVFSRNTKGVIYSRRMTRDASKAAKCSAAGKSGGGNPVLKQTFDTTFKGQPKGQGESTFALEARSQKLDIPKDSKSIVSASAQTLKHQKPKTKEEIKAIWQSNICREAQATMTTDNYALFLEAWANNDPGAKRIAEQLDQRIKARRAQGQQVTQ